MKCYQLCLRVYTSRLPIEEMLNIRRHTSMRLKVFSHQRNRKYDWHNRFVMIADDEELLIASLIVAPECTLYFVGEERQKAMESRL